MLEAIFNVFICLRHLIESSHVWVIFSPKRPIFLHACKTISELPSYISTMDHATLFLYKNRLHYIAVECTILYTYLLMFMYKIYLSFNIILFTKCFLQKNIHFASYKLISQLKILFMSFDICFSKTSKTFYILNFVGIFFINITKYLCLYDLLNLNPFSYGRFLDPYFKVI